MAKVKTEGQKMKVRNLLEKQLFRNLYRQLRIAERSDLSCGPLKDRIYPSLGFTFMELMMVVAILTAALAAGVVGMNRVQSLSRVRTSVDEVRSMMILARELAVAGVGEQNYQVVIGGGIVTVRPAGGEEMRRFQVEKGVELIPASVEWEFVRVTGEVIGCELGCVLLIRSGGLDGEIRVGELGMIE